jgi:hypothetical protein
MRRLFCLAFFFVVLAASARAADPSPSPVERKGKLLHGWVAKKKDGDPAKTFLSGTTKIYGLWKGEKLKAGDEVRAVWMAEAFGYSHQDVKITEATVTAYKPDDDGVFSLARPAGGWPIGRYRLELYVGDHLAETIHFTIEQDVTVEIR